MTPEGNRLEEIKAKMTTKQRADMAEIINNEIKRREGEKSKPKTKLTAKSNVGNSNFASGLGSDEIGQLYADSDNDIRQLRLRKLEEQIQGIRGNRATKAKTIKSEAMRVVPRMQFSGLPSKNVLIMYALIALGATKILFSTGLVSASVQPSSVNQAGIVAENAVIKSQIPAELQGDKDLLTSLDQRRAELEERKAALDKREQELTAQMQTANEKLAELKGLTAKLNGYRTEKDQKHETRLEQLAEVYGSMAPNQAAPLVGKLDDVTALSLLQRMTGKRMGQILSSMDSDRAIALTKLLTDRKKMD